MKMSLLNTTALVLALNTTSSIAEPLVQSNQSIVASTSSWAGFYAGLNAGYGWGTNSNVNSNMWNTGSWGITEGYSGPQEANAPFSGGLLGINQQSMTQSGFIGGGQFGYNHNFASSFIVGFEADIQGSAARGNSSSYAIFSGNSANNDYTGNQSGYSGSFVSAGLDYLGTARGRFGYFIAPTLLAYCTAGLAYGGAWANIDSSGISNTFVSYRYYDQNIPMVAQSFAGRGGSSALLVGYSVGGGFEWMFMRNWSLKGEALYYNLGNMNVSTLAAAGSAWGQENDAFQAQVGSGVIAGNSSINYQGITARIGANYHFNLGEAAGLASF